MDSLELNEPVTISPMKSFPVIKDLVTDVSWNYKVNKRIPAFKPRAGTDWKMQQEDIDRVQEFRKCIECFLCQNVCHVLRDHAKNEEFGGRRC
jgi:succinate dehydrogenase / fumarate reductase iron-sulfur subunit